MEWREYFIYIPIALLILRGSWMIPLWIGMVFKDAKKWREKEPELRKDLIKSAKRIEELEKLLDDQHDLIEGMEVTIDYYREYTGIRERDIAKCLEEKKKKEKSKKRKKRK